MLNKVKEGCKNRIKSIFIVQTLLVIIGIAVLTKAFNDDNNMVFLWMYRI